MSRRSALGDGAQHEVDAGEGAQQEVDGVGAQQDTAGAGAQQGVCDASCAPPSLCASSRAAAAAAP